MAGVQVRHFENILSHGNRTVSWCASVRFGKCLDKFKKSDLDGIAGQPHAPQGVHRLEKVKVLRASVTPPSEQAPPVPTSDFFRAVPRAVYITKVMPQKHGHTANCGKSRALQRGQRQATVGHEADCMRRMEELLANLDECQRRLEQTNDRMNHDLADEVENEAKKRKLIPSQPDPKTTMVPSRRGQIRWSRT